MVASDFEPLRRLVDHCVALPGNAVNDFLEPPKRTRWPPHRLCDYVVNGSELPDRLVVLCVAPHGALIVGVG